MKKSRRFGTHKVEKGPFAKRLNVATRQYHNFIGELTYLHGYLNNHLMPAEPEEVAMFIILANLQNLLEHESETLIEHYATLHGNAKEQQFAASFSEGFVSFRCKFDWLLARALITQDQWDTMEEIRRLRNDHIHARPSSVRCRHTYRGFPLLTQRSVRRMFVEVELVLRTLREKSGQQVKWPTVPPGFASELHWPTEYVQALETN